METIEDVMSWYVYKPHGWGHTFSKDRCAFQIHDTGRSVGFHQCSFKPKETVEGYGFCGRHATAIKDAISRAAASD